MADVSTDKTSGGCGLFGVVFGKNKFWPRRSASTGTLSSKASTSTTPNSSSKRSRNSFHDDTFVEQESSACAPNPNKDLATAGGARSCPIAPPPKASQQQMLRPQQQHMVMTRSVVAPSAGRSSQPKKQVPKEALGISGELDNLVAEHQRAKGGNANLVRASSGNVMLYGHLGNLRQPTPNQPHWSSNGRTNNHARDEGQAQMPNVKATSYANATTAPRYSNSGMGNIVKNKSSNANKQERSVVQANAGGNSLCRAISCRMDPEELKILGNEDYKNGRFAEALALYERAIDIDPSKASYRSNKSAALTALGRLLEAVFECREAIQIDPQYHRAHHRLANLHLRLGEAEKALNHYKQAGPEADPDAVAKAKVVLSHLKKCDQAKRIRDWNSVLKETENAISAGADSAPMMFALQAEALLKLHRHEDADMTLTNGPCFEDEQCTKFFGPAGNAALLLIRAQVDTACGRFEEANAAAQRAGQLDPSNREVNPITRRARAIAAARGHGNDLFRVSRFSEASTAYSEGLEHDPYNSVLLSNRAACRSKLGQYEKAIEDCNAALKVRPSYNKARLRRADCNSKLGKWEIAIQDYEVLMRESPGDEEVGRALFEAQLQLKKKQGVDVTGLKFGDNDVIAIQSNERFRHFISLPGLTVVLFCNKPGEKQTLHFMDQLCKRYPTINFLKVEVDDLAIIAKSEGVVSFPAFKIYKNGSKAKEVPGDDHELLESFIKECTT